MSSRYSDRRRRKVMSRTTLPLAGLIILGAAVLAAWSVP
jgi:hypothetical protein